MNCESHEYCSFGRLYRRSMPAIGGTAAMFRLHAPHAADEVAADTNAVFEVDHIRVCLSDLVHGIGVDHLRSVCVIDAVSLCLPNDCGEER